MGNYKVMGVGIFGLVLTSLGLFGWAFGYPLAISSATASTEVLWFPAVWLIGIIVLLSTCLASCLRGRHQITITALLVAGYIAIFYIPALVLPFVIP